MNNLGDAILSIITNGEGQDVEFKSKAHAIGETICSFANTNGGIILVDVSDNGKIVGCHKKHEQVIANIAHTCKPSIYPSIDSLEIGGKNVFVVNVKKSSQIHSFKNIAYIRVGTHDKPLSAEELIEFAREKKGFEFDSQICEGATLVDIDQEKIREFLEIARKERGFNVAVEVPVKEVLMRLNLLQGEKLTNAAVIIFGKEPQRFFSQSVISCVRFKGDKPIKPFIDMKLIKGNAIDQVDNALNFVLEHIPMAVWLSGKIQREEKYQYPPDALREAIVNAVCHRDYTFPSNVHIRVFDNRVEVWNPGELPKPLTPQDLKKEHRSIPRNRRIAEVFYLIKLIERIGTGTNDMIDHCRKWGVPSPRFEHSIGGLAVTFVGKLTEEYLRDLGLNERQIKAIEFLKRNKKITNADLKALFLSVSSETARLDLSKLVKLNLIEKKGEKKGAYYVLK